MTEFLSGPILDPLVNEAIEGLHWTADGERVMLPLTALIELGLVSPEAQTQLQEKAKAWNISWAEVPPGQPYEG